MAAKSIFKEKNKPNAIICDSNILMVGMLEQLKEMNINVSKDVKIMSFGNNPLLKIFTPYISFISQPISEIGKTSFYLFVEKIQNKNDFQNKSKMFKAKLI
ncbi:MAG: substrate-binding domain-containing protein [Flavobacteriaceae bacterium]|nr:substrate-binding domain-containing protein [Flavobacteriaceae bacterium]